MLKWSIPFFLYTFWDTFMQFLNFFHSNERRVRSIIFKTFWRISDFLWNNLLCKEQFLFNFFSKNLVPYAISKKPKVEKFFKKKRGNFTDFSRLFGFPIISAFLVSPGSKTYKYLSKLVLNAVVVVLSPNWASSKKRNWYGFPAFFNFNSCYRSQLDSFEFFDGNESIR